jgi:DNA (cytosine-5)-methyltransferase 1
VKLRLLDLFCGAGGCAVGYARAGFEVVGVDIKPQPRYPFEFIKADALEYLAAHSKSYDVIHASPPCQSYSRALKHLAAEQPKLIEPIRDLATRIGKPYVIENVQGAPLSCPVLLCGTMFGLPIRRHRLFETSFWGLIIDNKCSHKGDDLNPHRASSRKKNGYAPERQYAVAMGVSWMNKAEAREAIPPAYTHFIGCQLMEFLLHAVKNG